MTQTACSQLHYARLFCVAQCGQREKVGKRTRCALVTAGRKLPRTFTGTKGATCVNYELLAIRIRRGLGLDFASSPWAFAQRMHLEIVPRRAVANGAELIDRAIHWDATLPLQTQRESVAREMCRWALRASGDDDSTASAVALVAAMFRSSSSSSILTSAPRPALYALRPLRQVSRTNDASQPEQRRRPPALSGRRR